MHNLTIGGLVFLGGGIGSLLRFSVGILALKVYNGKFPLGTLLANFLACIILGWSIYYFKSRGISEEAWFKYFLLAGICGGFSTFSTFSAETVRLFQDGLYMVGIINIVISLLLGIGVLFVFLRG